MGRKLFSERVIDRPPPFSAFSLTLKNWGYPPYPMTWLDNLNKLDPDTLKSIDPAELDAPFGDELSSIEGGEVDAHRELDGDRTYFRKPTRRTMVDLRAKPEAVRHLERLPAKGETLHGIISGRYALWDLCPAVIERTGKDVDHLRVATLSYSQANAADILARVDAGQIRNVSLMVSAYFKGTSRELYEALVPPLMKRGHRVLAMRTHAKILLMQMSDGERFVVESSANLRSCGNVEQFCLTRDAGLHDFHAGWMDEVIGGQ